MIFNPCGVWDKTRKLVEEHAKEELSTQKNGWRDFDSTSKNELNLEKFYLIRYKVSEERYSNPYLAWWNEAEGIFVLMNHPTAFKLHVDQYFEIPE